MKIIKYALAGFLFVMGAYFLFNTFIKEDAMPKVKLTTSYGDIVLELDPVSYTHLRAHET